MIYKARFFLLFFAAFAGVAPCIAAPGTSGASFLRFTPSPRGSAMGDAQTAVTGDAYSSYWNPAGLALVETTQFAATHNQSFADVVTQFLGVAYPLRYGSTLGFAVSRMSVAPFAGYDSIGIRSGEVDASGLSVGAYYGRAIYRDEIARPVFSAGGGLKYVSTRLDDVSAGAPAVDLGAVYYIRPAHYWMSKIPAQEFRVALAARNLGPALKYDSGSTPLPAAFSLGGSWHAHPGGASELCVTLDNVLQAGDGYYAALGAEYTAFQLLSFRAGYRTGNVEGSGIRAGFGFRLGMLDLDYSISPFGDLGSMHKIGLLLRFGSQKAAQPLSGETARATQAKLIAPKEKIEKLELFAKDFLELAQKEINARRYMAALENIHTAFNLDPEMRSGVWGGREQRLQAVVAGLRFVEVEGRERQFSAAGEQPELAARSVSSYVDGAELKAFLLAHAARGHNLRGPTVFEELLNLLSRLTIMPVRREEILPLPAMVNKKLISASMAFKRKDYQIAARECEEITLLVPGDVLVWKRLGSAYYALGDEKEAKRAYSEVLKLAPDDESVITFMKTRGWQ